MSVEPAGALGTMILRTAVEPVRKPGSSALARVCGDEGHSPNG
jgi:hypothetical protein